MGGVGGSEPPSKRRKLGSSITDSSMVDSVDLIGSRGIKKVDFVRIIAESLHSLGYPNTTACLEKESGIALTSSGVTEFTRQILDGNWDEGLNSLQILSVLDKSVVKSLSLVILEQKFLEFLNDDKVHDALRTLRTEILPISIDQNQTWVRELSFLLLCSRDDVVKPKPKSEVILDLKKLFPPNVIIPQGRLIHLVEQALDSQQDSCLFHNSVGVDSLFSDHNCGRSQIPSETLQILHEHLDEVWFVKFSNNGKFLASCSKDKSAILWEVSLDGRLVVKHRLLGHREPVLCVSWSPNNDRILTCGVEEVVRCWDVHSGECVRVFVKTGFGMVSCNWSPDSQRVFTGCNDKSITMWDLDGKELASWRGEKTLRISDLQITGDGRFIISICKENMILIFDREIAKQRWIKEDNNIVSFSLSGDSKFLLVSLVNHEIHLWSLDIDVRFLAKYRGHKCSRFVVRACLGGVDQAFVASGSEDSQAYVWHRKTGELLKTLVGHSGAVNCTSWNPANPHMVASASDDRTIRIWGLKDVNFTD